MKSSRLIGLLIALIFSSGLSAQNIPYDSAKKQIIYSEVVNVPGKTKDELFQKSLTVLDKIYNQVSNKMDVKDQAAGKVELKCTTRVLIMDSKTKLMVPSGFIKYKLAISFKDGKYKYDFTDFHEDRGGYKYPMEKYLLHDVSEKPGDHGPEKIAAMRDDMAKVIKQLKAGMVDTPEKKKEDW